MLQAGLAVTNSGEEMKKVSSEYIYKSLVNPKNSVAQQIRQLRIIKEIDSTQYMLLKKQLPFFVCGIFNPAIRRGENFLYIEYFVLDIDKLSEKGMLLHEVRAKIQKDSRVHLSFVSPGEDGLKVMFKLKERCYDARKYTIFYKLFAEKFSQQYALEQVIDKRTCDVSRACFISMDEFAYFNVESDNVCIESVLKALETEGLFYEHKQQKIEEKQEQKEIRQAQESNDPDREALDRIKKILNPKLRLTEEKRHVYVPECLNDAMEQLKSYISQLDIDVETIVNIQYGKKMRFKLGHKCAEINLFYGKRGYSAVISPKSGTNPEFNELMKQTIDCFLYEYDG